MIILVLHSSPFILLIIVMTYVYWRNKIYYVNTNINTVKHYSQSIYLPHKISYSL